MSLWGAIVIVVNIAVQVALVLALADAKVLVKEPALGHAQMLAQEVVLDIATILAAVDAGLRIVRLIYSISALKIAFKADDYL